MSNKKFIFILGFIILFLACSIIYSNNTIIFYDNEIKEAFENYDSEMRKERIPINLNLDDHEVVISNCNQFLSVLDNKAEYKDTIWEQLYLSEYQICPILKAVTNAGCVKKSYFNKKNITEFIYKFLDITSFNSSLRPMIENHKKNITLEKFNFEHIELTDNTIEIETMDWYYTFYILAAGDFDNDGIEDIILLFEDDAKIGNYFSKSAFILNKKDSDGFITAKPLADIF